MNKFLGNNCVQKYKLKQLEKGTFPGILPITKNALKSHLPSPGLSLHALGVTIAFTCFLILYIINIKN